MFLSRYILAFCLVVNLGRSFTLKSLSNKYNEARLAMIFSKGNKAEKAKDQLSLKIRVVQPNGINASQRQRDEISALVAQLEKENPTKAPGPLLVTLPFHFKPDCYILTF